MAWFNADDKMHSHPKIRAAGLEAIGLWTVCGTYCTDYLTEGVVPRWYVDSWPRGPRLAQKLIDAGLWTTHPDGWLFLSWDEYQQSKDSIEEKRERWRKRQQAYRDKKTSNRPPEGETA